MFKYDDPKDIQYQVRDVIHFTKEITLTNLNRFEQRNEPIRIQSNGPFAASGHMVQNPPCWRASYALGHPKQRKCKFVLMKSLCSGCPSGQLALQHGEFCTM